MTADLTSQELEELPAKNLVYTYTLNGPGSYSFVLPLRHDKCRRNILNPGEHEFHIYLDRARIWGGYLWTVEKSEDMVRFGGEGFFSRFGKRAITETKNYSSGWDQYDLVWDLIDYSQDKTNGNLGITRDSTSPSGVTRYDVFPQHEQKKIDDVIRNIAERDNGFDFEIDPYKRWKVYNRKGGNSGLVFELGKNIRTYTYRLDGISSMVSDFRALGRGEGTVRPISHVFDAGARGQFGMLEDSRAYDFTSQSSLDDAAAEYLRLTKQPREDISVFVITDDPPFGAYTTGDTARVKIIDGYTNINRDMRIKTIVVNVPDEGVDSYGIYFDEAFE